jgi:hypothetical protein
VVAGAEAGGAGAGAARRAGDSEGRSFAATDPPVGARLPRDTAARSGADSAQPRSAGRTACRRAEPEAGARPWSCARCTLVNAPQAVRCEMCDAARGGGGRPQPAASPVPAERIVDLTGDSPAADSARHTSCGAQDTARNPRAPEAGAALPGPWSCALCTLVNAPQAVRCEMCDAARGGGGRPPKAGSCCIDLDCE